jgi:hypothetical protein
MTSILLFSGWAAILVAGVPEQDLSIGAGRNEGIAAGAEVVTRHEVGPRNPDTKLGHAPIKGTLLAIPVWPLTDAL